MANKTKPKQSKRRQSGVTKTTTPLKWTKRPGWLVWLLQAKWMLVSYAGMGLCIYLMRYYVLQADYGTATMVLWPTLILLSWTHRDDD